MVPISPRVRACVDTLVVTRWHTRFNALGSSVCETVDQFGTPQAMVLLRRSLRGVVVVVGCDIGVGVKQQNTVALDHA